MPCRRLLSQSVVLLSTIAWVACSDASQGPASSSATSRATASAPRVAPSAAAAPASSAAPSSSSAAAAPTTSTQTPPPSGIFPEHGADAILTRGAAPKLEVIGTGDDPKVPLVLAHPDKPPGRAVSLTIELPPDKDAPVVFELAFKADPDAKAGSKDGRAYLATIEGVHGAGGAPFPPKVAAALNTVKSRTLRFELGPHGRVGSFNLGGIEPKDRTLSRSVDLLAEMLSIIVPPLPEVPMGVGASWMVTERTTSGDYDSVRYAAYRVRSFHDDGRVTIEVDVQGYAASPNPNQHGLVGDIYFGDFHSSGKGGFNFTPNAVLPDGFANMMTAVTINDRTRPGGVGLGNVEDVSMEAHAAYKAQ